MAIGLPTPFFSTAEIISRPGTRCSAAEDDHVSWVSDPLVRRGLRARGNEPAACPPHGPWSGRSLIKANADSSGC